MQTPEIDLEKWGDRMVGHDAASTGAPDFASLALKPIAVTVTGDEIGRMYTEQKGNCNPNLFNQFLLERFKYFGAPVEGTLVYKLAHGAICRVKPSPMQAQDAFYYVWLPAEYAVAIAQGGAGGVN